MMQSCEREIFGDNMQYETTVLSVDLPSHNVDFCALSPIAFTNFVRLQSGGRKCENNNRPGFLYFKLGKIINPENGSFAWKRSLIDNSVNMRPVHNLIRFCRFII